jgi:tetratricopeptide (TPR) repeat protein
MDTVPSWFSPAEDESPEWGPCPSCGTANAAAARFCQACGRPLVEPDPEPTSVDVLTAVVAELVSASAAFSLAQDADLRLGEVRDALLAAGGLGRELPGNPHTVAAVFGPAPRDGVSTMTAIRAALGARDSVTVGDLALRVGIGASDVRGDDEQAVELWGGRVIDLALRLSRMAGPGEVILGEGAYRLVRGDVHAEAIDPRADIEGDDVGPLRLHGVVGEIGRGATPSDPPASMSEAVMPADAPQHDADSEPTESFDTWAAGVEAQAPAEEPDLDLMRTGFLDLAPAMGAQPAPRPRVAEPVPEPPTSEPDPEAPTSEPDPEAPTSEPVPQTPPASPAADPPEEAEPLPAEAIDRPGDEPTPPAPFETAPEPTTTALLEREQALASLGDGLDRAIAQDRPVVLALGGRSGSGRTSVARWFAAQAAERAWTVEIACRRPEAGGRSWPFAPLVRAILGVDGPAPLDTLHSRALDALGHDAADRAAAIAAYLDGSGSTAPGDVPAAIADLISATVARRPLVLVVDDADRVPAAARSAFDRVLASVIGPLLVVLVTQDEGDVLAEPLSDRASADLVERLLAHPNLPPDSIAAIVGACGGIPLALEHLVAMLADDGHLRWEYERWTPTVDLASLPLPADLTSLIARRVGGLTSGERRVAAAAALGADVIDVHTLSDLLGGAPEVWTIASSLAERGILRRLDDDRFTFGHDALAGVAATYAERAQAAAIHLAAADALASDRPAGPDVDEEIGAHLERAFRTAATGPDREVVGRRAAEHLARAARGATDVGDDDAALDLLRRAANLLPDHDAARAALLLDSAAMLGARGDRGAAERLLGDAVRAARAAGEDLLELRATVARARMLAAASRIEDQIEALRDAADAAIAAATAREDETTAAAAWSARGWVHAMHGHFAGAADAFANAAAASAAAGLRREELTALADLAAAVVDGPAPVGEAVDRARWILDRVRGTGVEPAVASALAVLLARSGALDEARAVLDGIVDAPAESAGAAAVASRAALVEVHAGSGDRARSWLRAALEVAPSPTELGIVHAWLAYVLAGDGDREEAVAAADLAATLADPDDVTSQVTWRAAKARCLAAAGRTTEARAMARSALRLADQTDLSELRARTRLDLAEVLLAAGRSNEAGPAARAALRALERKGSVAEAARARALLARIAGRAAEEGSHADAAPSEGREGEVADAVPTSDASPNGDAPADAAARTDAAAASPTGRASPVGGGPDPRPSDEPAETGKRDRHWFW